jgi:hypothetical protein
MLGDFPFGLSLMRRWVSNPQTAEPWVSCPQERSLGNVQSDV